MESYNKEENINAERVEIFSSSSDAFSLSFSSERFVFNETPDDDDDASVDCINKSGHLFAEFIKKPPTLEEALKSMGYGEKSSELCGKFMERGKDKLERLETSGVTPEDIATIVCYTSEVKKLKIGEGFESPYKKLNKSLSIDRSNRSLKRTRGFLFLLLQALRKLPRHTPDNYVLYRGMEAHVQTEADPEYPGRLPYAARNEKTWWTFTSTTEDIRVAKRFIKKSVGTLFTLSGEAWGYDISLFSDYPSEKEILLEPERKLRVLSVSRDGNVISVNAKILDTPLVLEDFVKVKVAKLKVKTSKVREVPENLRVVNVTENAVELMWSPVNVVLKNKERVSYRITVRKVNGGGGGAFRRNVDDIIKTRETKCTVEGLEADEEYEFRVCCGYGGGWGSWGKKVVERVSPFSWKKCPDDIVERSKRYFVDKKTPRIAVNGDDYGYCTIIGNTSLSLNKVTSWNIKILKSEWNVGWGIFIGVAPFDINQNEDNYNKCGWYFYCCTSTLYSGPPHEYRGEDKKYDPRKGEQEHFHTGDSVGVVMDTTKGELSFVLNGVNLGVAYEGIPLGKPLVPCVIICHKGDSIELDTSEVKENVDSSIGISDIATKSISWDSITLTWDAVEGALLYQIEVDGSKLWKNSSITSFTKRELPPDTEHAFRARAVRGNSVSVWSDVVKGRTHKISEFSGCLWKECPDDVYENRKYTVDENNTRIARKFRGDGYDFDWTIIGNTPLPPNTVTSWSIKILKSVRNDGFGIFIGVAPSDIDQDGYDNWNRCGWYFGCCDSKLWSGPPHKYKGKKYGPRKGRGQYVHTGDSVSVVMDTTKGELSFALDGVNLGVAFEGIPIDKPLVPCVLLENQGDSVELDTSEVKETVVDSSIPVPSNIMAMNGITWDSITLTWDAVEGASFYQIEVDVSKFWDPSTTNSFTKTRLLAETEHTFRVRVVRGNKVSEWSGVVRGRTQKESFETSGWKECPYDIYELRKYSIDENNSRVTKKIHDDCIYCTAIGNASIPLNQVISWSIKILKSVRNDGFGIFIGVAPSDINQNEGENYNKCGWYFYCYLSELHSGPPHEYKGKEYGPRKEEGQYVHTGDSVGVVMDTRKGELSFALNGMNLGVAYEGIPLDKPLVPCVLLLWKSDFVELVI